MREPSRQQMIEVAPSCAMPVRIYGQAKAPAPAVLHLHGGAFAGGLDNGRAVASVLAQAGALVFGLDYPCGADHPFPQPLEAAYQALCWIGTRQCKRRRLFVAGEESGGNLAAALALVARDRRIPPLAGQILLSPMLDPQLATCSVRDADAGVAACKWSVGWHDYLGTPDKACHPYAAPASAQRLAGVAPALVLTGPDDPMQDEARAYAECLRQASVPAEYITVRLGDPWPDALTTPMPIDPAAADPLWAAEVRDAVARFLKTPGAVP